MLAEIIKLRVARSAGLSDIDAGVQRGEASERASEYGGGRLFSGAEMDLEMRAGRLCVGL